MSRRTWRAGLHRELLALQSPPGPRVALDGRELVNLCGNDYLALSRDERVTAAASRAASDEGAGAGASRLVTGNPPSYVALEHDLAEWLGTDTALLFGSGYHANTGFIPALCDDGDLVLSDELNHASLIDGCRLSRATRMIYRHCDLAQLDALLAEHRSRYRMAMVITETIFSMDGDAPDLAALVEICERHDAALALDEAHALGVVGDGRGLAASLGLIERVDLVVGTFGKAFGSFGAFVAGSAALRDALINHARSAIFSTALPPAAVGAAHEALRIIRAEGSDLASRVRGRAGELADLVESTGHARPEVSGAVVPFVIGAEADALDASQRLFDRGVLARAIRPPTVPRGTSRIRLTACAGHTDDDMAAVASAFASLTA
ncbi:MAG: 8-amino-7-oxononanoate synthase [Deltaproteobacteria bacterium]|nr:8-amino-7-oxononanoate synthase [Deltaproteobacteria bacterium]